MEQPIAGGGAAAALTPERLVAIEARANAATAGPWRRVGMFGSHLKREVTRLLFGAPTAVVPQEGRAIATVYDEADREFIAHAREDVPWLVAEVRRLQREWVVALAVIAGEHRQKQQREFVHASPCICAYCELYRAAWVEIPDATASADAGALPRVGQPGAPT